MKMTVYEEIFEVIKARKAQYDAGNAPETVSYTHLKIRGLTDELYNMGTACPQGRAVYTRRTA